MKSQVASILATCTEPTERAQRALELLIGLTNSVGGFLYTIQEDGPKLTASDGKINPPPDMDMLVEDRFSDEIEGKSDMTQFSTEEEASSVCTVDFATQLGQDYRSVILGHNMPQGFAITGIAVLITNPKKTFKYPAETIHVFSKALLESGGVATVYAAA
jgi:hypothetical protein